MNNVAASPHKARLRMSIKKQGSRDFPCWQAGGLANPRGQKIWWKTDPHSASFFTPMSPFLSLKFIVLVSSESPHWPLHRTFGVGSVILCFTLASRGALLRVQASLCPLRWHRFIPGFSFLSICLSGLVVLDSPVYFWPCLLGMSSEDKIKLWVDKTYGCFYSEMWYILKSAHSLALTLWLIKCS